MAALKEHERMALQFLSRGPDKIGTISDENTMAAAIVYSDLAKRGLVHLDKDNGCVVTISKEGERALREDEDRS